jgi:hypothetical protein
MHGDHLTEHEPCGKCSAVRVLQLNQLRKLAFEGDGAFPNPWWRHPVRRGMGQPSQGEFVDIRRCRCGGRIHRLHKRACRQIPHELLGGLDIGNRVLPPDAGEADDWRCVTEGIEEAVGREVDAPLGRLAGNLADGTRANNRAERVVGQAVPQSRLIIVIVTHGWVISKESRGTGATIHRASDGEQPNRFRKRAAKRVRVW